MMDGALSRAIWKRFETSFSLSPIHFETRSEEEILAEENRMLQIKNQNCKEKDKKKSCHLIDLYYTQKMGGV